MSAQKVRYMTADARELLRDVDERGYGTPETIERYYPQERHDTVELTCTRAEREGWEEATGLRADCDILPADDFASLVEFIGVEVVS